MLLRKEFLTMQKSERCKNCNKSIMCGLEANGKTIFGCQEPFCTFSPVVENEIRNALIKEYENAGKNT
jgi:hypothetical protein